MEENREWDEEQPEFQTNEIVWAKITGFPWWPAKITTKAHPPHHLYRVDFFSDNTHAFLTNTKIAKYDHLRTHIDMAKQTGKNLRKAIAEADKALEQQKARLTAADPRPLPVEVINLNQKQLLQQSAPAHQDLQEKIHPPHIEDSHQALSEEERPEQEDNSQPEKREPVTPTFSRQQRQRFVKNLLKKYRLISLPKCDDLPTPKTVNKIAAVYPLRKRQMHIRKHNDTKVKRLSKFPHQKQTLSYLLSRKIHHFLKRKQGLNGLNSKQISLSLSRQLLCGGGSPEKVNRLFKWVCISSAQTITGFYQSWSSYQSDKEKPSNMTTQE